MAAPAKFLFDMDFSAPDKTRERPATAAEIAQKIAEAEARAYRAGYEAAQREAKQLALRIGGADPVTAERIDTEHAELIARLRVSPEGQHGLGAFLDKRAPSWVTG